MQKINDDKNEQQTQIHNKTTAKLTNSKYSIIKYKPNVLMRELF